MRSLEILMHISLDGFIGGPNGEMNWIHLDDEVFDVAAERTKAADTALYGKTTFGMMESYWPTAAEQPNPSAHDIQHSGWYMSVEKIVISTTLDPAQHRNIRVISKDMVREINDLKNASGKNILMLGSPRAAHFLMTHDLIDRYCLLINPVLLGQGIPLFQGIESKQALKLESCKPLSSGVVRADYSRSRS